MTDPDVSVSTKNECVCEPDPKETEIIEIGEDAHIQVAEWRLQKVQSPIELQHDDSIHHDHFEPLEFHGHWDMGGEATFTNNGFTGYQAIEQLPSCGVNHSLRNLQLSVLTAFGLTIFFGQFVELLSVKEHYQSWHFMINPHLLRLATLRFLNRELPVLKGGPLHEYEYVFEQLHFHWSEDDHSGCEHIFEGQAYSMEAHAVHYNTKYADFQEAQNKHDGLAVVAFFLKATDTIENPCFNKLSTAVMDIVKINTETRVPSDCLTWIKEEAQCKGYYTYQGSLTTEPYTESVTWILYPQPIHVSREQVAHFRNLNSTPCEQHNIKTNVRPIQKPTEAKKLNILYARSHRSSSPAPAP